MLADRQELSLHDSVQSHSVDCNAWALGDNDDQSALELEVDEESNVIGSLFTLGQLGEDQETTPSSATAGESHTLPDSGHWFEVAFCDAARSHDTECSDASVDQEDIGDDDGNSEDPFGDLERYLGLYLTGPLVEGEEIDGCESVGGVDGTGDENEDPEPGVGEGCQARRRPEVREVLYTSVWLLDAASTQRTM